MSKNKPFILMGERVRFIGASKYRYETWPEGKWLEHGVTGTVIEYHPESPAVRIKGEYFEALPPYAVVQWDLGAESKTAIDAEDEGDRWERIGGEQMRILDVRGKDAGYITRFERRYKPELYRSIVRQTTHKTTEADIKEFEKKAREEGAEAVFIFYYVQIAYIPLKEVTPMTTRVDLLQYYKVPPSAY